MRGWINYYGVFYRSELDFLAKRIDEHLVRWAMQKFKRLRGRTPGLGLAASVYTSVPARALRSLATRPTTDGRPVGAV